AVAHGHGDEAGARELGLAEALHQPSDQPALQEDAKKAGIREDVANVLGGEWLASPSEPALGEEREAGREGRERKAEGEELIEQRRERGTPEVLRIAPPRQEREASPTRADVTYLRLR